jgi:hypothetical protein
LRKLHCAMLALACVAFTVILAGPAAAATKTISAPRAGKTVSGTLQIRPIIKSKSGPYIVTIKLDGKKYQSVYIGSRPAAQKPVPIDTTELKNGRHRISITVKGKAKPRKASQTVRFVVKNNEPGPAGAGQLAPTANVKDFHLLVSENFDLDAPRGSFDNGTAWMPVYTGSTGTSWVTYPPTFFDTFLRHPYRPAEVLSVHNGVLDFALQPVDGKTAGASISPFIANYSQYQKYGRYSTRMRIGNAPLDQYGTAFLLWPADDEDYEVSESDFPENQLVRDRLPALGFAHYGKKSQQEFIISNPIDFRDWHTYTQEWSPGERRYYLDNKLVYVTKQTKWSGLMRWQIQVQSFGKNGTQRGHVFVDWAAVWSLPSAK